MMHRHRWHLMTSGRGGYVRWERCEPCGASRIRKGADRTGPPAALLFAIAFLIGFVAVLAAAGLLSGGLG